MLSMRPRSRVAVSFGVPDRREHLDHQGGIDIGHRQRADHRRRVGRQGTFPLRHMLGVTPAAPVCLDVTGGALVEGHAPGLLGSLHGARLLALDERITPLQQEQAAGPRQFPRTCQTDDLG
jgi:hypothetical protein